MQGKIALEEHFAIEETVNDSRGFFPDRVWQEVRERVLDLHGRRLQLMDQHGIEMMLLSLNAPAVQAIPDPAKANELARRANDYLAEQVRKRPDRFQGLAALPMQDPELAAQELQRCVNDLGFKGALVNGFSQVGDKDTAVYYDLSQYRPFWQVVERLDVPFYLHPRNPLPRDAKIYEGHSWLLGPVWAFGQETAVHALRLMGSGLFDEYPRLAIVLGHMGEGLPFSMWRVDHCNAWIEGPAQLPGEEEDRRLFPCQFPPDHVRQLPHPDPDRRHARDRIGPHHVLGRLAVREYRPRRGMVRRREHQRERPHQDRPHQCDQAVQAEHELSPRLERAGPSKPLTGRR